jgi:ATP-dependent RNA helicase RhlE
MPVRPQKETTILKNFNEFKLDPALGRGIADLGFTEPTPIQIAALPPGLAGRDVLACAMTGSGKTAAFVLPILQRILKKRGRTTRALVLTPTRELASQIHEHLESLARHTPIRSATVFGGVKPAPQERALRAGVDVVIATPGRLLDLMQYPWASFADLEVLVLDEADRMLDMGFLPDIRRILGRLPTRRQNLLFSATLPRPIVELSRNLLNDPVRIDRQPAPATGISQSVLPVSEKLKPKLLIELLERGDIRTALVFTRTKHRANRLADKLGKAGISVDRIHGNRSQKQREQALAAFKGGRLRVLVATDIAARGIDINELPHVVNFDVPAQPEDYIHRVGRTARSGSTGDAFTFFSPAEAPQLRAIERAVGRGLPRRRLDGFDYDAEPAGRLEIPVAERLAAHRAQRAGERARAKENAERQSRRTQASPTSAARATSGPEAPAGRRHRRSRARRRPSDPGRTRA